MPTLQFGPRAKVATAIAAFLIMALVGANIYASSSTTPEAAAMAYVDAVGANSADAIWSHMTVTQPQGLGAFLTQGATLLLSEGDLKAMLAIPQNTHHARGSITASSPLLSGDSATVTVSYQEDGQRRSETLSLQRDRSQSQFLFYPTWKVAVAPGVLSLKLPTKDSRVAIEGTQLSSGASSAVVLPGAHRVTLQAWGPFATTDQIAVVQSGASSQVSFSNLKLTAAAQTAAHETVKSFFTSCLQRTDAQPSGCPQSLSGEFYPFPPVQWQLVGDPTAGLNVSVDPTSQNIVLASAHYLMTAMLTTDSGTAHRASGGPYSILLSWNGHAFQVQPQGFGSGSPPALPNPGASQSSILAAVQAGWQACLQATTGSPPDCASASLAPSASAGKWSSSSDPMARAIVNWDGSEGIYKVTGDFNIAYSWTELGAATPLSQNLGGSYSANVVWDGQKVSLVNIQSTGGGL